MWKNKRSLAVLKGPFEREELFRGTKEWSLEWERGNTEENKLPGLLSGNGKPCIGEMHTETACCWYIFFLNL